LLSGFCCRLAKDELLFNNNNNNNNNNDNNNNNNNNKKKKILPVFVKISIHCSTIMKAFLGILKHGMD